jgi:hypothetical protein
MEMKPADFRLPPYEPFLSHLAHHPVEERRNTHD